MSRPSSITITNIVLHHTLQHNTTDTTASKILGLLLVLWLTLQLVLLHHKSAVLESVVPFTSLSAAQVATDTRLWLLNKLNEIRASLADLIRASVARAEQDVDVLMPGFTHLQPAMTVRWSHWLLSHTAAWQRDDMRLRDLMPRVAMLPLGSGRAFSRP